MSDPPLEGQGERGVERKLLRDKIKKKKLFREKKEKRIERKHKEKTSTKKKRKNIKKNKRGRKEHRSSLSPLHYQWCRRPQQQ